MITPHEEYLRLGRNAYRDLFTAHLDPERLREIHQATNDNYALGNERFRLEIEQAQERAVDRHEAWGRVNNRGLSLIGQTGTTRTDLPGIHNTIFRRY